MKSTWSLTELAWGEDEYTLSPAAPLSFAPAVAECFVLQSEPELLHQKALTEQVLHAWLCVSLWE